MSSARRPSSSTSTCTIAASVRRPHRVGARRRPTSRSASSCSSRQHSNTSFARSRPGTRAHLISQFTSFRSARLAMEWLSRLRVRKRLKPVEQPPARERRPSIQALNLALSGLHLTGPPAKSPTRQRRVQSPAKARTPARTRVRRKPRACVAQDCLDAHSSENTGQHRSRSAIDATTPPSRRPPACRARPAAGDHHTGPSIALVPRRHVSLGR